MKELTLDSYNYADTIASALGISKSTVYQAFKPGSTKISERKRNKVIEIAEKLQYDPSNYKPHFAFTNPNYQITKIIPRKKDLNAANRLTSICYRNSNFYIKRKLSRPYLELKNMILNQIDSNVFLNDNQLILYAVNNLFKGDLQSASLFLENEGFTLNEIKECLQNEKNNKV